MKHLADELDTWRLVWILFFKMHDQPKSPIFKRGVCRADDYGVPISRVFRGGDDAAGAESCCTMSSHYLRWAMRTRQQADQSAFAERRAQLVACLGQSRRQRQTLKSRMRRLRADVDIDGFAGRGCTAVFVQL